MSQVSIKRLNTIDSLTELKEGDLVLLVKENSDLDFHYAVYGPLLRYESGTSTNGPFDGKFFFTEYQFLGETSARAGDSMQELLKRLEREAIEGPEEPWDPDWFTLEIAPPRPGLDDLGDVRVYKVERNP